MVEDQDFGRPGGLSSDDGAASVSTLRASIPDAVKSHPDYADGYGDAFAGYRFDTDRAGSEEYAYGYEAGDRAVKLFEQHGFRRSGGGMGINLGGSNGE